MRRVALVSCAWLVALAGANASAASDASAAAPATTTLPEDVRVAAQSFATMPMGYRGLMLADGRLWLQLACPKPRRDGGCRDGDSALRLVAINVTAPEAPAR